MVAVGYHKHFYCSENVLTLFLYVANVSMPPDPCFICQYVFLTHSLIASAWAEISYLYTCNSTRMEKMVSTNAEVGIASKWTVT